MTSPIVLSDREGVPLWFNQDVLTFKATSAQTAGAFVLFEEHSQRGKMTPLHDHPAADESFYVLEGELLFHVYGTEHRAGPGAFLSVPRGVPHAFMTASDTARTLVLITPGEQAMEAFFHDAGEPAREGETPPAGPLDIARIQAAAERHGAVRILGPPPFG